MTDFQTQQQNYKQLVQQLKNKFTEILNCGNSDYRNEFIRQLTIIKIKLYFRMCYCARFKRIFSLKYSTNRRINFIRK